MSEAILSQTVMPLGPEVMPVLTPLASAGLQVQEIHILECAPTEPERQPNDGLDLLSANVVDYSSLFQGTTSEEVNEGIMGLGRRITILNFDPSKKAQKTYVCSVCNKVFDTNDLLRTHMQCHTEEESQDGDSKYEEKFLKEDSSSVNVEISLNEDEERPFRCSICSKTFKYRYDVNVHIRTHTGEKPYECSLCGKRVASSSQFHKHIRIHNREVFKCNSCMKIFISKQKYERHMRIGSDEDGDLEGPVCMKRDKKKTGRKRAADYDRFDDNDADVAEHSRVLTGQKPYECVTCGKTFRCKSDIRRHVRVHTGKKPYACFYCVKTFSCTSNLYTHMRRMHQDGAAHKDVDESRSPDGEDTDGTSRKSDEGCVDKSVTDDDGDHLIVKREMHKTGTKLKCVKCYKCFDTESEREDHMEIHRRKRPFECAHCRKQFFHRYELRNHLRKHTGEKPFLCNLCGNKYHLSRSLYYHMRNVHNSTLSLKNVNSTLEKNMKIHSGESKPYECSICSKRFRTRSNIRLHIRIHTGEKPYVCSYCFKTFSSKSGLNTHSLIHTRGRRYHCTVCKEAFGNRSDLLNHMKSHKGDNDSTATNEEIEEGKGRNSGDKFLKCSHCDKTFSCTGNRVKHMRIHTGEMPYKCLHCGKKFRFSSNLQRHTGVFKGKCSGRFKADVESDVSYDCYLCNASFSCRNKLTEHMNTHRQDKPYPCSICSETFSFINSLYRHMRRFHKGYTIRKKGNTYQVSGCDDSGLKDESCYEIMENGEARRKDDAFGENKGGNDNGVSVEKELGVRNRSRWRQGKGEESLQDLSECDDDDDDDDDDDNDDDIKGIESHVEGNTFEASDSEERLAEDGDVGEKKQTEMPYQCSVCGKSFRFSNDLTTHEKSHGGDCLENGSDCQAVESNDEASVTEGTRKGDISSDDVCHEWNGSNGEKKDDTEDHSADSLKCGKDDEGVEDLGRGRRRKIAKRETDDEWQSKSAACHVCGKQFVNLDKHMSIAHKQKAVTSRAGRLHGGKTVMVMTLQSEDNNGYGSSLHDGAGTVEEIRNHESGAEQAGERVNEVGNDDDDGDDDDDDYRYLGKVKIDWSPKPHDCAVCGKSFRSKRVLSKHTSSHEVESGSVDRSAKSEKSTPTHKRGKKSSEKENLASDYRYEETRVRGLRGIISKGKNLHKCKLCDKTFAFRNSLYPHMRTHTGDKPFKCDICPKSYNSKYDLDNHLRIHTGQKPFSCSRCDKTFRTKREVTFHSRVHTGEKPYKCPRCDLSFRIQTHLTTHLRTHTGERPNQCTYCSKRFSTKYDLTIHVRIHTGERPYQCTLCDGSFISNSVLHRHLRTHTGEKRYKCTECDRAFYRNNHLLEHLKKHSGDRPFACSVCDKSFYRKAEHIIHMRIHTGEKPYQCSECGKMFCSNSNLNKHKRTHLDVKPFECNVCGKKFAANFYLRNHMKTHNRNPLICSECGETFKTSRHLKTHMKVHELQTEKLRQCSECGETFGVASDFYKHMIRVHEFNSERLAEIAMQY